MTILGDAKQQDLTVRFKKMADGVYVEAKRGALGGVTQVPFYFYVLLLLLGWNEIMAGELHVFYVYLAEKSFADASSASESLPYYAAANGRGWRICHLHAQPVGPDAANGHCRKQPSGGNR